MTPVRASRRRISIRRKLVFGFGFALLMLALIALITWRSTRGFLSTAELVARSRETLETGERALRHLTEMERDRRGFLISGQDDHLRDYEEAQSQLVGDFTLLERLTTESPEQRLRIRRMKHLVLRTIALQRAEINS